MKLAIGCGLLVLGAAGAFVIGVFNSSTPLQLGPIPFFGCAMLALIGLILAVSAL